MLDMVNRSHTNPHRRNSRKPFKWILADSIIVGLIAMTSTMPSTPPSIESLWVMFKAFLTSFVLQLAIERGVKQE